VLQFVPTVYSDQRLAAWPGGAAYLQAIGTLPPSVGVWWTGTQTASPTLAASDLAKVSALIGRKPLIWDNYWANDLLDKVAGRVGLGPYLDHAADLGPATQGIAQNPLIQGALSRLVMARFAAWIGGADAAKQDAYTAASEARWSVGLGATPDEDRAALADVLALLDGDFHGGPAWPKLEADLAALTAGLGKPIGEIATLAAVAAQDLARVATLGGLVDHSGLDPDLVDELAAPLARLRTDGLAGLAALEALSERLAGRDGASALAKAKAALTESEASRFLWGSDGVAALVAAAKNVPAQAVASSPPSANPEPLPPCRVGAPWTYRPFDGATSAAAYGLPGASVAAGVVTFLPRHPGRYEVVATATAAAGWAARVETIVCRP
jgi:hypothetical protein